VDLLVKNIQQKLLNANVVYRIMYITLAIFLFSLVFNTFSFFLNRPSNLIFDWFALGPDFSGLLEKPWTIISYGFLHDGFLHILFNLVMLYYFGTLFLDYFTEKQFLYYYFTGIVFGGFMFQLSFSTELQFSSRTQIFQFPACWSLCRGNEHLGRFGHAHSQLFPEISIYRLCKA